MARKTNELTAYGLWLKITLAKRDMTNEELAKAAGILPQRVTDVMRGRRPLEHYRPKIEKALGESPPVDIQNAS